MHELQIGLVAEAFDINTRGIVIIPQDKWPVVLRLNDRLTLRKSGFQVQVQILGIEMLNYTDKAKKIENVALLVAPSGSLVLEDLQGCGVFRPEA